MLQPVAPPITLLIVDDHHLFRDGLVHAFSEEPGMKVVAQCSDGLSTQDIARQLFISERTARATVAAVKEKLGAATIGQAVARGYERGILEVRRTSAAE